MTGFKSKQAAAQAKLTEDDDIQDYVRPWVSLTGEELLAIVESDDCDCDLDIAILVQAKLKEKNT